MPNGCSWCRRKLLKLRDVGWNFIHFKVGDGSQIQIWLDKWHRDGILYQKFGHRMVYEFASHIDAKLSTMIIGELLVLASSQIRCYDADSEPAFSSSI